MTAILIVLGAFAATAGVMRFVVWQDTPRKAYSAICPKCQRFRRLEFNFSDPTCRDCFERITAMIP